MIYKRIVTEWAADEKGSKVAESGIKGEFLTIVAIARIMVF
jgi:hypothetical protein